MKVKDIIKDDKFNEFLGYEIEAYNKRPAPQEGYRYRRTPYDALKDAGIFTVEGIRETFIKVANLESDLPKSQRDAITGLVFRVAQTVVNYRAKQEVEAKSNGMNKGEITYTIKVKRRTGLLWNTIFWLVFFTVVPLQLVCLWLSKGLALLSDLLRKLCYRAWFKQTTK